MFHVKEFVINLSTIINVSLKASKLNWSDGDEKETSYWFPSRSVL